MEHRGRYRWRLHVCLKSVICRLWVEWHFSPLWKLPFKIMAPRSEEAEAIITRLVPVKKKTCVWWGGHRITFHEELCLTNAFSARCVWEYWGVAVLALLALYLYPSIFPTPPPPKYFYSIYCTRPTLGTVDVATHYELHVSLHTSNMADSGGKQKR